MQTSKWIQLTPSVLLEWRYADREQINEPGNPYRLSTDTVPLYKMNDNKFGESIIFNAGQIWNTQTGNLLDSGWVKTETEYSTVLSPVILNPWNDYDTNLTNTSQLPVVLTNAQSPVYDTLRLYFTQGSEFEGNEGLMFSVLITRNDGTRLRLLNQFVSKSSPWLKWEPTPFIFGNKSYESFVEWKVLSAYDLAWVWYASGNLNNDDVVYKITDGKGPKRDGLIETEFFWIDKIKYVNDWQQLYFGTGVAVDLPYQDQFAQITAYITESNNGDWIEFGAQYGGNNIEGWILDAQNSGFDFVLLHSLTQSEYVYNPDENDYNWIITDQLEISQTDKWDEYKKYRPIINYPSAISYRIQYTVALWNRIDNTQIWKTADFLSDEPQKWGRFLKRIIVPDPMPIIKVYNKRVVKDINIPNIGTNPLSSVKWTTTFLDKTNIGVSFRTDVGDFSNIESQGLATIHIPSGSSWIGFTLWQFSKGSWNVQNLLGVGTWEIVFNDLIRIPEWSGPEVTKTRGEIVFRISESSSSQILSGKGDWKLVLTNERGERNSIYSGTWLSTTAWKKWREESRIKKLSETVSRLTDLINLNTQREKILKNSVDTTVSELKNFLSTVGSRYLSDPIDAQELTEIIISGTNSSVSTFLSEYQKLTKLYQETKNLIESYNGNIRKSEGLESGINNQTSGTVETVNLERGAKNLNTGKL